MTKIEWPDMLRIAGSLVDRSERGVLFGLGALVYNWKDPFGRLFLQTLAMSPGSKPTSRGHL